MANKLPGQKWAVDTATSKIIDYVRSIEVPPAYHVANYIDRSQIESILSEYFQNRVKEIHGA